MLETLPNLLSNLLLNFANVFTKQKKIVEGKLNGFTHIPTLHAEKI